MEQTPNSPAELVAILADAHAREQPVTPFGAGLHQHLGAPPPAEAMQLRTTALNRVVEYEPADLTVTLEAGVRLAELQALLHTHNQWLPWEPPGADTATVGGLLAAGMVGPLRLGYGTPRDRVLGMRVALGDGRLVKSGGRVVKNVAGFDTHKLHIGALGTLGVIAEITFKLAPLPERDQLLVISGAPGAELLSLAAQLRERPFAPAALFLCSPGALPIMGAEQSVLLVRFTGVDRAVERLKAAATALANAAGCSIEMAPAEAWRQARELSQPADNGTLEPPAFIVRCGIPPARLPDAYSRLERLPSGMDLIGYPGVGLIYGRCALAGMDAAALDLERLRRELAAYGGYIAIEYAPPELRPQLDLWGPLPDTIDLMRALKARWDPRRILNRGRYLGGI